MNGWNDLSRESRLEVSVAECQGSLGFDQCQIPVTLYLRKGLSRVSLMIFKSEQWR